MAGVPTDWQLGCVEVKQRGEYLVKSGLWSDCTFLVGAEPNQVIIAGHKLVLAMASPVFEAMFYGGMAESNDPIPILDVQPEAFRTLLEYVYTDNINISSFDIACELYYSAKKYMLPHLVKECSRYLWSNPEPGNACRAYELARLFEENVHMNKCIEIISLYTKEVLTDSNFEDVELNTVITVFSLDHLNVDNELDLFEAAVRYAKAQDKRSSEWSVSPPSENGPPNEKRSKSPGLSTSKDTEVNVEGSAQNSPEAVMATQKASDSSDQPLPAPSGEGNNKPDPKSDKPTIRSVIEKIRFLTLTPQQFVDGPARFSLLTVSEACAVLMNITSSSSDVAMPSGFSTCRVPRKLLIRIAPSSNQTDDLRRKRAELSVALRKLARDEQLLKSRALSPDAREEVFFNGFLSMGRKSFSCTSSFSFLLMGMKPYTPAEIVQGLLSDDLITMTTYARAARVMLSRTQNPPISSMVTAGVIKPLVDALHRDDCADLQFEAAWAITNIATGTHEHTMAVVDGGAIPKLVVLLARGGVVGEQSTWALSNIAGDGPQMRDAVLSQGALAALLPLCTRSTPVRQLRTAMWTYRNFCRYKDPPVKFDYVAPALPYISDLLEITDEDVLADACWALSYLTNGPPEHIEAVQMTPQLLPRVFSLLGHTSPEVRTPALRAIGNMLTGSDKQTDRCLDAGCLDHIVTFLRCDQPELMKDAAWAVSNILAGTHAQIQRAVDFGVLQPLLHVFATEDIKCQNEAAWAITNLCRGGTPEQRDALISAGLLEPYCQLLSAPDRTVISVVLDGLTDLLKEPVKRGQVDALCMRLEQIGAVAQIRALQQHEDEQICKQVLVILDNIISRRKKT